MAQILVTKYCEVKSFPVELLTWWEHRISFLFLEIYCSLINFGIWENSSRILLFEDLAGIFPLQPAHPNHQTLECCFLSLHICLLSCLNNCEMFSSVGFLFFVETKILNFQMCSVKAKTNRTKKTLQSGCL